MKRLLSIILVLIFMAYTVPAFADSEVILTDKDLVHLELNDVETEISRLEKEFPALQKVEWQWYTCNNVKWAGDFILGETLPVSKTVYLYSPPLSHTTENIQYYTYGEVDHEMGHVVRCEFISGEELAEYYAMRTEGLKVTDYYFNTPEELFAEDFKSLWGMPGLWRKSWIPKPTESDKQWILQYI